MVALADSFRSPAPVTPETHTPVTLLYVSGLRYYRPSLGRWVSRDPLGERAGVDLYGFVRNEPTVRWDLLGMQFSRREYCACCDEDLKALLAKPPFSDLVKRLMGEHVGGDEKAPFCLSAEPKCGKCRKSDWCGVFSRRPGKPITITICCGTYNQFANCDVEETLKHELQHAADWCEEPWGDCQGKVCAEYRANFCSGDCTTEEGCAHKAAIDAEGGACKKTTYEERRAMALKCGYVTPGFCHTPSPPIPGSHN